MLIGNLGRDPEVRNLENGTSVASFSIATTETYKNKNTGEIVSNTDWHNIVAWRGLADVCGKYLKKGDKVYVEGKLRTRNYQDQQGVTKYITEVVIDDMVMLTNKNESGNQASYTPPTPQQEPTPQKPDIELEEGADDLPF